MASSSWSRKLLQVSFIFLGCALLSAPSPAADLSAGISWLKTHQNFDGSWGAAGSGTVRSYQATAAAIEALQSLSDTGSALDAGKTWLSNQTSEVTEETAWRCGLLRLDPLLTSTSCTELQSQMQVSGWGAVPENPVEALDTARALDALAITGLAVADRVQGTIGFLLSRQQNDGGWGYGENSSVVYLTAEILSALVRHRAIFPVEDAIQSALAFLSGERDNGGMIGEGLVETALAYRVAIEAGADVAASFPGTSGYLQDAQALDGSWEQDEYTTAVVLRALSLEKPNLVVRSSEIVLSQPFPREGEVVTVNAIVRNVGSAPAENVQVRFFDGEPGDGVAIGDTLVVAQIPASGLASATAIWNTTGRAGNRRITVQVDPQNAIDELSESDNTAGVAVTVVTLPDLVVTDGDIQVWPQFPTPSDTIKITATIRNSGQSQAGPFSVVLFSAAPELGGVSLGAFQLPALGGGQEAALEWNVNLIEGRKQLFVVVDPGAAVAEMDESNNRAMTVFFVYPSAGTAADLAVASLAAAPSIPTAGAQTSISAQVANLGALATPTFLVQLWEEPSIGDRIFLGQQTLNGLATGAQQAVNFTVTLSAGEHPLLLLVDPTELVAENYESNNSARLSLKVLPAGSAGPDLVVRDVDISTDPIEVFSTKPSIFTASVHNAGNLAASSVRVDFYDGAPATGGNLLGTFNFGTLSSDAVVSAAVTTQLTEGLHEIHVVVDGQNAVGELDESNNQAARTLLVLAPLLDLPDLVVWSQDISSLPSFPKEGEAVRIAATIRNIGTQPASNVTVRFYEGESGAATLIAEQVLASIPNQGWEVAEITRTMSLGAHRVTVVIDEGQTIAEINEQNNVSEYVVNVLTPPDLQIAGTSLHVSPEQPYSDEKITLGIELKNLGQQVAEGATMTLYDGDPAAGGAPVGAPQTIWRIYGQSTAQIEKSFFLGAGSHNLFVVLDAENKIAEGNEGNNLAFVPVTVSARADLSFVAGGVTAYPGNPTPADRVALSAIVRNTGGVALANVAISFFDGSPESGAATIGTVQTLTEVPAGGEAGVTTETLLGAGYHDIFAIVDPQNAIVESNERNNQAVIGVLVQSALPDLVIKAKEFSALQPGSGAPASLTAKIWNYGSVAVQGAEVKFYDGSEATGTLLRSVTPNIPAGASVTQSFEVILSPGTHDLVAVVDPSNALAEASELNNRQSFQIKVAGADSYYDDCGVATNEPRLLQGSNQRLTQQSVQISEQNLTVNTDPVAVKYQYTGLAADAVYRVVAVFLEDPGAGRTQRLSADGTLLVESFDVPDSSPLTVSAPIPRDLYADGQLVLSVERLTGPGAIVSQLWLTKESGRKELAITRGSARLAQRASSWNSGQFLGWETGSDSFYSAYGLLAYAWSGRFSDPVFQILRGRVLALQSPDGSWVADAGVTAISLQALLAAGEQISSTVVRNGVSWLIRQQNDDGGWAIRRALMSVPAPTGLALATLVLAGESQASLPIQRGVQWLKATQNSTGYWGIAPGDADNQGVGSWPIVGLTLATSLSDPAVIKAKPRFEVITSQSLNFISTWSELLRYYYYCGGSQSQVSIALVNIGYMQNADGSWTNAYRNYPEFVTNAILLEHLGMFGQRGTREAKGFAWLASHLTTEGNVTGFLSELDISGSATSLISLAKAKELASDAVRVKAENAFIEYANSNGSWPPGYFVSSSRYTEPGGMVLQALKSTPYTHPSESAWIAAGRDFLLATQSGDGGWPIYWSWGYVSTLVTTAQVLRGLLDTGLSRTDYRLQMGVSYLLSKRGLDGGWGNTTYTSLALRVLLAEGLHVPETLGGTAWLKSVQNPDGGWGSLLYERSVVSETSYALIALSEAGERGIEIAKGVSWLLAAQNSDGGWGATPADGSNTSPDTALAVWALSVAQYNLGVELEILFDRPWYYPGDLVSMAVNPLNRSVNELELSGWLQDQERRIASLPIFRGEETFGSEYVVDTNALPGIATVNFAATSDDAQGSATDYFIVRDSDGVLPDLVAQNGDITSSPEHPAAGEAVTVQAVIHNAGLIDARSVTVRFYHGDPAAGGRQIGPDLIIERVPGLGARTVQTTWLAASDPPQVFLVIDPDNGIAEINEGNNSASKWVQVNPRVSLPDLKIASGDVTFAPASPYGGELTQVAVVVHNVGDKSSGAGILRLFDADPRVGGRQIGSDLPLPAIIPGGIATAQLSLDTTGRSGRIYVYAIADPDNALSEISETNNQAYAFVELRQPALPDLVIGAGGLEVPSALMLEGETVNLTVHVQNRGLAASGVEVALYDSDPATGGILLAPVQTIPGIFGQNESRTAIFTWSTTGKAGNYLLYAVVDPDRKIAEYHEDNNSQSSTITVGSAHLALAVATNGSDFGANMPVQIQVSAQNNGTAPASALLEVKIEDSLGNRVAEVVSSSLDLAASEVRAVPCNWNTGVVLDGAYRVVAKLLQLGRAVVARDALITITPDLTMTSTVVTDKIGYRSNETARITWRVQSGSVNHDFTNLTATLTVADTVGGVLFTDQRAIPSLVRGQRLAFDTYWGVATRPPGAYPLSVRVTDGTALLVQALGTLTISATADPKTLLAGTISAAPQVIFSGDAETVSYSIRNIGNRDLPTVRLAIKVVSTDQQTVHAELTDTASLAKGAQYAASQTLSTVGFSAADYLTVLVAEIDGVSTTLAGTYFRIQGAPSAPSVNSPTVGSKVTTFTPSLIVNNAADPNALDKLTYFFELYEDSGLTQLIAFAGPLAEGLGTTGWQLSTPLAENTSYWWRCRAYDTWAYGEWMPPASFFVNTVNDPPGPPTADHPLDGQSVAELQPLLAVKDAFDPDTDALTYNFRVATDSGMTNIVANVVGVFETPGTTAWQVNVRLAENSRYWWSAQADDWLIEGPWMAPVSFFVNTANDAPTAPVPVSPTDGTVTGSLVTLEAQNATDPDSAVLTYLFEVDSDPAFTSAALITSPSLPEGAGITSWTIPVVLTENSRYYWRAKANDGEADSPWSAVCSFFVNTVNEPPSTPSLANPSDGGEVIVLQPALAVHNAVDPDGDGLSYEFEVYADAGLAQRVVSVTGIAQGAGGLTSWNVTQPLNENTRYWWRARAFDGTLYGAWMPVASFFVNSANDPPSAPALISPANGASVALLQPVLTVGNAIDPEGAPLTYQFEVYGDAALTAMAASVSGIGAGSGSTSWTLSVALQDNHQYWWRCRAFDGDRYGAWMPTATLTVHVTAGSLTATINFDPDTLNLGSKGTWVTVYIELPVGYNVRNISPATVKLNGIVPAEAKPVGYGDEDKDGIPEAMLKFRRSAVEAILAPGEHVVVKVTGKVGSTAFEGVDIIRVINP